MAVSISVNDLDKIIDKELNTYCDDVTNEIKKATDEVMKELVQNTKRDAPTRTKNKGTRKKGTYKRAISSKTTFESKYSKRNLWYVKDPEYRLSHLLEKGHATRNGGRTRALNFISKNEEIAVKEYEKKVEEAIKNGH